MFIDTGHAYGYWLAENLGTVYYEKSSVAIGVIEGNGPIASVVFHGYNKKSIQMSVFSKKPSWMSRRLVVRVFTWAFDVIKASKVICQVSSNNKKAISALERLGFRHEATIEDGCIDGNIEYHTLSKEQWAEVKRKIYRGERCKHP